MNQEEFRIKSIEIENFKGIKSVEIFSLPKDAKWIFLTGENGYGKTSVLQAIAFTLANGDMQDSHNIFLFSPFPVFSVQLHNHTEYNVDINSMTDKIVKFGALENATANELNSSKNKFFTCYGSSRLDTYSENSKSNSSNTQSLFSSRSLLKNIELQLSRWYFKKDDQEFIEKYEHVTKLLITLLGIHSIKIDEKSDKVYYLEKDSNGNVYKKLPFQELASGYRNLIAMIGDMILRLFEFNEGITNPKELNGIVIIDELDLHLHPIWQKRLPTLLSNLFPKIQFIASTHSEIPILGAPIGSVILKVNRDAESGITVERLESIEKELGNLSPNLLLSSPVFGLTNLFPTSHNEIDSISTEDTYSDMLDRQKLEEQLKQFNDNVEGSKLYNLIKNQKNKK